VPGLSSWEELDDQEIKSTVIPKSNLTIRDLLIKLGTDIGRDYISEDHWVNIMRYKISKLYKHNDDIIPISPSSSFNFNVASNVNKKLAIIIPDIRFENELIMVREYEGITIKIKGDASNQVSN